VFVIINLTAARARYRRSKIIKYITYTAATATMTMMFIMIKMMMEGTREEQSGPCASFLLPTTISIITIGTLYTSTI